MSRKWWIIVAAGIAVALAGVGVVTGLGFCCVGIMRLPKAPPKYLAHPALPRAEFYKAVIGKSEAAVRERFGEPDKITASKWVDDHFTWEYTKRTNSTTATMTVDDFYVDLKQEIVFSNGVVVSVHIDGHQIR